MKKLLLGLALAAATAASPAWAQTDAWPARPIKLVVPFAPGGTTDLIARAMADRLTRELGQPVIVDNKAGASGAIGSDFVAKALPDGYTIGMATVTTHAVNPAVFPKLSYNVLRDLAPVTQLVSVPNVMTVSPNLGVSTMAQFLAREKEQSGKLTYGSPGPGSEANLMGELFNQSARTHILHVPYRGAGPALQDAMAGQIDAVFDNLPSSLPFIQTDKLRALAVAAPKRIPQLPAVPTFEEVGLKPVNDSSWFGLVAPAKTPAAIVDRLQAASARVLATPDMVATMEKFAGTGVGSRPEAFRALLESELKKFKTLADAGNIRLE
ncbi:ABC transporter substrate-binding protein [Xylophilus rhododendri]|uniref:ABC transporter substrate-binding protein n=1 Tax=Xylophilus rhododendri TaxID=2697032 RepID=A0A857J3V2_9BURK|nr:tripartite tricarboxylate transporter substrate binding protein [Xylophilus rhododendri]QHI97732.1 ABC transporter substrate-binding protein [Xylophilus rhododendri]